MLRDIHPSIREAEVLSICVHEGYSLKRFSTWRMTPCQHLK